jgi:hypothetical protein
MNFFFFEVDSRQALNLKYFFKRIKKINFFYEYRQKSLFNLKQMQAFLLAVDYKINKMYDTVM